MLSRHPLRDGVVAGLVGAASVAAWFFVLDVLNGRPFFTPAVLGAAVLRLFDGAYGGRGLPIHVAVYTVIHVALFVALGIAAAAATNAMERKPSAFNGFLVLFAILEAAYLAGVGFAATSELFGVYAWWQFGIANLIAALLMGRYIWQTHHPKAFWQPRTLHEKRT
jgi:F0F1-type ATP synthase membrane subunit c/vacuolar-type H+-ATPase subunit K